LRDRARQRPRTVFYDAANIDASNIGAIDVLARLQLEAARTGRALGLKNVSRELRDLIAFAGLDDVLCLLCCDREDGDDKS
jgi:ABC-type transporter Mla MlaB component